MLVCLAACGACGEGVLGWHATASGIQVAAGVCCRSGAHRSAACAGDVHPAHADAIGVRRAGEAGAAGAIGAAGPPAQARTSAEYRQPHLVNRFRAGYACLIAPHHAAVTRGVGAPRALITRIAPRLAAHRGGRGRDGCGQLSAMAVVEAGSQTNGEDVRLWRAALLAVTVLRMTTMDEAIRGLTETGASVSERDLVRLLARHEKEEESVLARYERFASDARSPAARYLIKLIIEDERRHHRMLIQLANAIAWGVWQPTRDMVPDLDLGTSDAAVTEATRELLDAEQRDHADLRQLRKKLRNYRDTTLWDLVADILMMDTDKHIRILRFLIDHAGKGNGQA